MRVIFLLFLIVIVSTLVFIAVRQGGFYYGAQVSGDIEEAAKLMVKSDTIPILYPHEHKIEDSVGDLDHHIWEFSEPFIVEEDVWITSFELFLENAPLAVVHHAGVAIANEPNQICPNSPHFAYKKEIFSVTPDMAASPVVFPEPYGLFLSKGTPLILGVMYHNPLPPFGPGEVYKNVSTGVVMDIQRDNPSLQKKKVEYYRLHIDEFACPGAVYQEVFTVLPHTENFTKHGDVRGEFDSSRYTFSRAGSLLYMVSHLHPWEGGEKLDVFLNKKQIATFLPTRTSSELWSWITPHRTLMSTRVESGEELSITATYSNPNDVSIIGAMGMLVFYFAPDE